MCRRQIGTDGGNCLKALAKPQIVCLFEGFNTKNRRPVFQSKARIRWVTETPNFMRPTFQPSWKLPCMVIGLRFNNQASFLGVSGNLEGEELSKYCLARTLPSSVPRYMP